MQRIIQSARPTPSSAPAQFSFRRLSWPRFFLRYPIFLLTFGPPLFRAMDKYAGVDTTKAHFDIWTILQFGLLGFVSLRALLRFANAPIIRMTAPVRSIIRYCFFLGLLFAISIAYSPGRMVSFAYDVIYFLILISITEFLVDAYRTPPDWMQCLFAFRLVSLLLFLAVLVTLPIHPGMVLSGLRLLGGSVASVPVICPFIAVVSAYSCLYSLEPRRTSVPWFFVGFIGTALTRARGAEISLFFVLCILGFIWARRNLRSASFFATVALLSSLLVALIFATGNTGEVWQTFNRGEDTEHVMSLSGRTDTWVEVISYCIQHPQGMGYIAGLRASHFTAGSRDPVMNRMGGTDNSYFETLADGGWLGLALYLLILIKTFLLGWRQVRKRGRTSLHGEAVCRHAISCALLLITFCIGDGMDASEFSLPLMQPSYFQWITLAILMGAASTIILATRRQRLERIRTTNRAMHSLPS